MKSQTYWDEVIAEFGFSELPAVFDELECESLLGEIRKGLQQGSKGNIKSSKGETYAARNLASLNPGLMNAWRKPALVDLLRSVLGDRFGLVRVLYFDKNPNRTWSLPWHKDMTIAVVDHSLPSQHFTKPTRKSGVEHVEAPTTLLSEMLTLRIHLDMVTNDNGPLQVAVGSHRNGKAVADSHEVKTILADAGEIKEARSAFTKAKESNWNKVSVARKYYQFEKEHGTAEEARQAYTELRDLGFENDPFLYRRFQLFNKFPELAWDFRDALGLLSLLGLFLGLSLLPLLFIIPVHYWGLLRQRAGKTRFLMTPFWNLRRAWGISALLIVNAVAMSYYFSYDTVFEGFFDDYPQEEAPMAEENLAEMVLVSDLFLLIGVGLIAGFRRSGNSFRSGEWSVTKCIGVAFLWMVPLRMIAGILETIYPEPVAGFMEVSITIQSLQAVLSEYGPLALFMTLAVITPIVEEIIFRGVILTSLASHIPFWAANVLQAALFTAMHEAYEFFPFLFAFGLVTGRIRKHSGSLLSCMVLHAINNGLVAWGMIAMR